MKEKPIIGRGISDLESDIRAGSREEWILKYRELRQVMEFAEEKGIEFNYSQDGRNFCYRPENETAGLEAIEAGELDMFLEQLHTFNRAVEATRSQSQWNTLINGKIVWSRATVDDLKNPGRFLARMAREAANGGLGMADWEKIGDVKTRRGEEIIWAREIRPEDPYTEGPVVVQFESFPGGQKAGEADRLPAAVFGVDSDREATIYAIQQESVGGLTAGRIDLNRQEAAEAREKWNEIFSKIPELKGALLTETGIISRENWRKAWELFRNWAKENKGETGQEGMRLIRAIGEYVRLEEVAQESESKLGERTEALRRFNTIKGGASMFSLLFVLASFKQRGIETVRMPLRMPFAPHLANKSKEEVLEYIEKNTRKRVGVLADISGIGVRLSEEGGELILDLGEWDLGLRKVNSETRELDRMLAQIRGR